MEAALNEQKGQMQFPRNLMVSAPTSHSQNKLENTEAKETPLKDRQKKPPRKLTKKLHLKTYERKLTQMPD